MLAAALGPGPAVVIAGDPQDPRTRALVAQAQRARRPGGVLSLVEADPSLPLHEDRRTALPTAFLCTRGTCSPPILEPAGLADQLIRIYE